MEPCAPSAPRPYDRDGRAASGLLLDLDLDLDLDLGAPRGT